MFCFSPQDSSTLILGVILLFRGLKHNRNIINQIMYKQSSKRGNPHHHRQESRRTDVALVIQLMNQTPYGYMKVADLVHDQRLNFASVKDVSAFISRYPNNFMANKPNNSHLTMKDMIWVKTTLEMCMAHCRRKQSCDENCDSLHICRNFLLNGKTGCPFNRGRKLCYFGHDLLRSQHNKKLLIKHNLHYLGEDELQILFKRRACRCMATMPQVCLYYNAKGGKQCTNVNCQSLHICLNHVRGLCIGICNKQHELRATKQNKKIFNLFAIGENWAEEDLLSDLKSVMENSKCNAFFKYYLPYITTYKVRLCKGCIPY